MSQVSTARAARRAETVAVLSRRIGRVAASVPARERVLAAAPPGSGLLPVPGRGGLPLLGDALSMLPNPVLYARERYARFGPVSWCALPGLDLVIVTGPDAVGEVFANKGHVFANGPAWGYFIGPFFERGLMLLDFEEHLGHRRIMQEAFARPRLERYLARMNAGIARSMATWRTDEEVPLYDAIKQMLLDVATEVFVGAELGDAADRLNEAFIDTVHAGLAIVRADVPGGRWRRGLQGREVLERYFREKLPEKRRLAASGQGTDDLFSVLCGARDEDGEAFSDDDVVNHMIFALMAAHDTSTITSASLAYHLAAAPQWQRRLREEALAVGHDHLQYADVDAMPLLDQAFKEALRLNPPVGAIARMAVRDTSIAGHHIPEGTMISVALAASHRLPEWWTDPDVFDPERFGPERREDRRHRWAWTPFGGGAHKCIGLYFGGLQVKAILHQLLLGFEWSVPPGYEPVTAYGTGEYPVDGLPVRLTRR